MGKKPFGQRNGKVAFTCEQCGKEDWVYKSVYQKRGARFCGQECANKARQIIPEKICPQCGKVFRKLTRCCSRKCMGEYGSGTGHHSYTKGLAKRVCKYCGDTFYTPYAEIRRGCGNYCSSDHYHRSRRLNRIERRCLYCGDVFKISVGRLKFREGKFCGDSCRRKYMVGPQHPSWTGGYYNKAHTKIKKRVGRRIHHVFTRRGMKKEASLEGLLGYSVVRLEKRLRETVPPNYTWTDFIDGGLLHIDHIIPDAAFNYTSTDDPDFARAWALDNLRLLPAKENIIKGATLYQPMQPSLSFH